MKIKALFVSIIVFLSACNTTIEQGTASRVLPNVTGGAGEILVVSDQYVWDGNSGEAIKDILMEEINGLPQSEPLFDLIHITKASFGKLYKYHRSILLVTIKDGLEQSSVRFLKDVYAKPQIMVRVEASSSDNVEKVLLEEGKKIQNFFIRYDRQRLMDSYSETADVELKQKIAKDHKIMLDIPRGYNLDFSKNEYTSISIEASDFSQVLQIYEYPGTKEDLKSDNLIRNRNKFTKKYVKGPREGSYMTTAKSYPPVFYDISMNGMEVVEIRGLWELEGGYMGGPFISHSVYDSTRKRIVTVEGYLYYPNQKKRVKLKQLEAIIYSMKLI